MKLPEDGRIFTEGISKAAKPTSLIRSAGASLPSNHSTLYLFPPIAFKRLIKKKKKKEKRERCVTEKYGY